jgi:adhesin/invasin
MLFGNGLEETDLLALVTDANGNPVGDGFDVNFTADSAGSISPASTQTLGDGTASARFIAPVLDEDIAASVTAECEGASESWSLLLRGVQLALTAEDDRLLADGHSTTSIRARLSTPDGAAITGRRIDFATSGGAITRFATTDETGVAAATLTAGSEPDTAMVTANFGPYLADTLQIIFSSLISGLELSADPASLLGDGQSRTTVTISVFNGVGDPASGVRVNLSASAGRLSRSSLTTGNDGQGQATLTGFSATDDDSIMVTAATSDGALKDTMFVVVRGIELTVTADRDSLPANGAATTTVTARAVETGSGNPVTGARVSFSASSGSITASATLDEDGLGEVTYTAAAAEGTATIRARLGAGLQAETSVVLVDPVAALTMDITPSAILANGVQTAEITARVTDPWGEPTPNELVTIDFSGSGSVTPSLGNTDENGRLRAAAKGTASGSDGQLIITAEAHGGDLIQTDTLLLRGVTLALSASPALIPGDGQSTSSITARVRETRTGRAVASGTVSFIASAGVIAAEAQLDQSGEASVELRSDDRTAISEVVAFYGDELTDTIQVAFAGRFSYLDARSGRVSLLADGEDTTAVAATLTDTLGNAASGIWVRFNVGGAGGTLTVDSALTDNNGRASVLFTSAAATSDAVTQVISATGVLSDTVSIARQGLTLTVAVAPDSLPANGRAISDVSARVRKTSGGNPITGRPVSFAVTAGLITGSSALDQQGVARVQLTADDSAGTATITASFGQTLSSAANVVYVGTEGSVELSAARGTLLGDGVTNVQITALVLDELGSPAEGATVNFSAPDGGRLSSGSAQTDRDGLATVTFTGFASRVDSVLTIDAVTGGGAADDVTLRLLGITTELSASPSQLRANGRATSVITLKAYETTAHNALADYEILFNADRGTIGRTATTGADGQADVTFTAPASVGNATINAVLGDTLLTTISLSCLASQPARATLSVDPRELSVAGGGGDETALLSADVTDDDRQPVPDGTVITFTVQPDIGVIFAGDDDTIDVTTEDGIAIATVVAGDESGAVTFKALFGNSVLATGAELTIKGGPPARIRVRPDVNTIYQPAGGVSALPVSATVSDQFGNPAPDSTAVRFTLVPDTIAVITATGYTEGGVVMTPVQPIDYPTGVWLTYDDDRAGSEVWVHATSGGGAAHDSSRVVLPGAIEGGEPASMALSIDDAVLPADGQTTAEVTVELFDANGNAVADLTEVTFTSVWGTIQRTKQTAGGVVTNTYRAGRNAGVDTVTVTSGLVSEFITIQLTPGNPAAIEVAAADPVIRAGGVQATDITATVRDQFGNLVAAGARVDFTADLGTITSNAETDAAGVARARLTSGNIIGTTQVTARSGNAIGQTSVRFVSGGADGIVLQSISRNSIGVRGSGSPETATLVFEVRDEWGVPVDSSHRAYVQFTLDGPALVIDPAQSSADSVAFLEPAADSTDDNGRVAVNLTSGFFAGTVEVTALVGPNISGQAIAVAIHGGPPDFDHLSLIVERCVLTGIYGTEVDTTRLTAVVGDRYANPTVPGTIVYFSASGGVVTASETTDSLGVCNALLTTSNPWPIGGVDTLTLQTVDWNDQDITAENYVLVTGPTIVSFDTSSGWAIPFGSYRDFTVTVADTFDHPLVAGTSVFIQVEAVDQNGETVSGLRVIGDATEEAYVIGECDGKKDFSVRVFNFVSGLDGALITMTVTVESRNGNVEAITSGAALGQIVSAGLSRVILNPNEIIADGADESEVDITVYDVLGVAIPGVPPDMVSVSIAAGNPIITQPQASSDQDGRASATIVGRALGSGNVQVRVTGLLLTEQPTLTFIPGPPAAISVLVLDRRLVVGGDSTTVVVNVTDASGNNVADGTAVIFEADDGSFSPSSAVTSGGSASSLFRSGVTAGDATITITASGQGAEVSEDVTNLVFLPGPPGVIVISADNYSVEVGAATDVTITVKDQFGNVVTENTRMDVTVSPSGRGSVAPTSIRTDAEGSGGVQYTAGTTAGQTARLVVTDPAGGASDSSAEFMFKAGPARRVTLTASPSSATVGTAIDLDAIVTDAYGNDVSDGTLVTFIREPAVGTVNPSSIGTVSGAASSRLTNVTASGSVTVTATSGDVNGLATIQFTPDVLSTISLTASPTEIDSGQVSTITATAKDRFGNVIAGEQLNFELANDLGGTVSLWRASLNTNASGVATNYIIGGNQSGWAEVRVYNVGDTIEETVAVRVR